MRHIFVTFLIVLSLTSMVIGQTIDQDRLGIGFNLGAQKLFGDVVHTGFGLGFEAYAKYKINEQFSTGLAMGYGELSDGTFHLDASYFTTNMLTFDVKGMYFPVPNNIVHPNLYLGLGAFNFSNSAYGKRWNDISFFYGGGLEFMINPQVGISANMDYRFTTGDDLDPLKGGTTDGYLNFRTGITYYMRPQTGSVSSPKILANGERAPVDELDGSFSDDVGDDELNALIEGIDNFEENSSSEYTMDEYVKLKSRVDDLNDKIQQKEFEIDELRAQLVARQDRVAQLENRMRSRGGALAASFDIDASDFSANYEKGLESFYAQEYDAAIYIFNSILDTYPNHALASNCQYWVGECYFGKGNYENAIQAFNGVFQFENSVKKDDALLMMGRCYLKMGDSATAAQMFNRLMSEFPDSEYFYKAEQMVSSL
ncbi:tetratricopeptide repeat protein [candidate division KSB1 bacterium]|nr:tetratricopeptide repeat protein [candidate division KSB1 bacterium]